MLKFMVVAAPLLGGGVWAAGGLDAFKSAAAAHRERQAVCDDIVDRAIDDVRNGGGFAATGANPQSAALESHAWMDAVATEVTEAGCDPDRAGARFVQGAAGLMAGDGVDHAPGEPTDDAEGIAPLPEMMRR